MSNSSPEKRVEHPIPAKMASKGISDIIYLLHYEQCPACRNNHCAGELDTGYECKTCGKDYSAWFKHFDSIDVTQDKKTSQNSQQVEEAIKTLQSSGFSTTGYYDAAQTVLSYVKELQQGYHIPHEVLVNRLDDANDGDWCGALLNRYFSNEQLQNELSRRHAEPISKGPYSPNAQLKNLTSADLVEELRLREDAYGIVYLTPPNEWTDEQKQNIVKELKKAQETGNLPCQILADGSDYWLTFHDITAAQLCYICTIWPELITHEEAAARSSWIILSEMERRHWLEAANVVKKIIVGATRVKKQELDQSKCQDCGTPLAKGAAIGDMYCPSCEPDLHEALYGEGTDKPNGIIGSPVSVGIDFASGEDYSAERPIAVRSVKNKHVWQALVKLSDRPDGDIIQAGDWYFVDETSQIHGSFSTEDLAIAGLHQYAKRELGDIIPIDTSKDICGYCGKTGHNIDGCQEKAALSSTPEKMEKQRVAVEVKQQDGIEEGDPVRSIRKRLAGYQFLVLTLTEDHYAVCQVTKEPEVDFGDEPPLYHLGEELTLNIDELVKLK